MFTKSTNFYGQRTIKAPPSNNDPLDSSRVDIKKENPKSLIQRRRLESLLRRAEQKEREFKSRKLVANYPSTIEQFHHWRVYNWQELALEAILVSSPHRRDLHAFSFESAFGEVGSKGQCRRKFLVTSYHEFWHYYRQLDSDRRHFYEIIPESAACKMYFDVEYYYYHRDDGHKVAPSSEAMAMEKRKRDRERRVMETFFAVVIWFAKKTLGIDLERRDFLDLDSSTPSKFSRHVILCAPGKVVFETNRHLGVFVGSLIRAVEEERSKAKIEVEASAMMDSKGEVVKALDIPDDGLWKRGREEPEDTSTQPQFGLTRCKLPESVRANLDNFFFIVDERRGRERQSGDDDDVKKECCIVDKGVYTKNRAFRLFLSSKAAKKQPLVLARDNAFRVEEEKTEATEDGEKGGESRSGEFGKSSLKRLFLASLICNVSHNDEAKVISYDVMRQTGDKSSTNLQESSSLPSSLSSSSPYPKIDAYIEGHVIRDDVIFGAIRRSVFFAERKVLVYDIQDYRFCRRVGRHHASNNIQIFVDVIRGTWHQRCLDPDCRDFRSNEFPIPTTITMTTNATTSRNMLSGCLEDNEEDDELDDETLFGEVVKLEGGGGDDHDLVQDGFSDDEDFSLIAEELEAEMSRCNEKFHPDFAVTKSSSTPSTSADKTTAQPSQYDPKFPVDFDAEFSDEEEFLQTAEINF